MNNPDSKEMTKKYFNKVKFQCAYYSFFLDNYSIMMEYFNNFVFQINNCAYMESPKTSMSVIWNHPNGLSAIQSAQTDRIAGKIVHLEL